MLPNQHEPKLNFWWSISSGLRWSISTALGGQFKSARGGQFHRFLQLPSISNPLAYAEGGIALTDDPFFTMTTPSLTSTEVTGYFYFVKAPWPGIGGAVNTWIPFDPATTKAKFCYSLHVFDEEAVDEIEVVVVSETTTLSLYPNPTSSISYLVIAGQSSGEISYSIANIAGQVVDVKSGILLNDGVNNVIVDFKDLTSGIYTLTVFNSSFTYSFKVVRL